MSEKKVTKKAATKTAEKPTVSKADKKAKQPKKKSKAKIAGIIIAIAVILVAAGVATWLAITANALEEVPTEDEDAQMLLSGYFYGNHGCFDSQNSLLKDGKVDVKNLDYTIKERTTISYLAYYKYSGITYDQMNELYHTFFDDGSDLHKKTTYQVAEGTFTLDEERGSYTLEADCASPKMATCVIIERAYKSDKALKMKLRVFTRDIENKTFHAGINAESDPLEFTYTSELDEIDLPQWEANFKYNENLGRYILDSTNKL